MDWSSKGKQRMGAIYSSATGNSSQPPDNLGSSSDLVDSIMDDIPSEASEAPVWTAPPVCIPSNIPWKDLAQTKYPWPDLRLWNTLHESGIHVLGETLDLYTLGCNPLSGTMYSPGDLMETIRKYPDIAFHAWNAVRIVTDHLEPKAHYWNDDEIAEEAMEQLLVEIGLNLLDRCEETHFTLVDPRLHDRPDSMIYKAISLIRRFEKSGIDKDRVVVRIPATEDGVVAARHLTQVHRINVNLTHVVSLAHAAACAESGAASISIAVGKLLDWYETRLVREQSGCAALQEIQKIQAYYQIHGIDTNIIGTGIRNVNDIHELAMINGFALSQGQIEELGRTRGPISGPTRISRSSTVYREAWDAKFPKFLEIEGGFQYRMPAATESALWSILYTSLGEMKAHMDTIEDHVRYEIERHKYCTVTPTPTMLLRTKTLTLPMDEEPVKRSFKKRAKSPNKLKRRVSASRSTLEDSSEETDTPIPGFRSFWPREEDSSKDQQRRDERLTRVLNNAVDALEKDKKTASQKKRGSSRDR